MDVGRVLTVLLIAILINSAIGFLLYWRKAPGYLHYILSPVTMTVAGCAFAWVLEITDPVLVLIVSIACGLLGVQGAWIMTTRLPR